MQTGTTTMGDSLVISYKARIGLPYNPAIMLLISTQMSWKHIHTKIWAQICIATLFIIAKKWESTKMSFDKWMDKQHCGNVHNDMLFSDLKTPAIKPQREGLKCVLLTESLKVCLANWKGYMLSDSNYRRMFWKRQNDRDSKWSVVALGFRGTGGWFFQPKGRRFYSFQSIRLSPSWLSLFLGLSLPSLFFLIYVT